MANEQSGSAAPGQPATTSWLAVRLPRLVLTLGALLIAIFAIMPWVSAPHQTLYGSQVELTTGFGDGRLVALLGLAIAFLRIGVIFRRSWEVPALALIVVLALGAMGLTARAALHDWSGDTVLGWLYADVAMSVLVALCACLVLTTRMRSRLSPERAASGTTAGG